VPRSVKEWFPHKPDGTPNDDAKIPPRVKLRVIARANDCCQICGVRVRQGGGDVDHICAIIAGGENRENNLRFLCRNCHGGKTRKDVAQKAADAKTQKHLAGFKNTRKPFYVKRERSTLPIRVAWIDEQGRDRVTWLKPAQSDDADNGD
jgi:5-methylcytosine-specific restriction protein A